MKRLTLLAILAALAAGNAAAQAAPAHPELASFADVYRLAVGEAKPGAPSFAAAPVRVSIAQAAPGGARFTVRRAGPAEGWLLILSGLAAAGWVAHRRLVNPL